MAKKKEISSSPREVSAAERYEAIRERLRACLKGYTWADVSRDTGVHPETIRRYLLYGKPSAAFLMAICEVYEIDAEWLLCGRRYEISKINFSMQPFDEYSGKHSPRPTVHVNRIIPEAKFNGNIPQEPDVPKDSTDDDSSSGPGP